MRKSSVVTPLTIGFLLMEALMGFLLWLSLAYFAKQLYIDSQYLIGRYIPVKIAAVRLEASFLRERWAADRYTASGDTADRQDVEDTRTQQGQYLKIVTGDMGPIEQDLLTGDVETYHGLLDDLLHAPGEADRQAAEEQVDQALTDLMDDITLVLDQANDQIEEALTAYNAFFQRRFAIVLGVGAGLMLFGAWTGLTLGRSITQPLARLTEAARRPGGGDLTIMPDGVSTTNEIGSLAESFRQMTASLGQAIDHMRETAGNLTHSAGLLSTSATNLSGIAHGTLAQMEQIAQGAAAQREQMQVAAEVAAGIAATLRQSAQQAGLAEQAAQKAQTQLDDTARTVAVLDQDAAEIQHITAVIEQFAQETHMLSLNAAIEARRAGEAGRGFAAVSDEMRALAERSAVSAGEAARFGARAQAQIAGVGQAMSDVQTAVTQTADFAGQTLEEARQQEQDTARLVGVVEQAAAVSDAQAQIAEQVSATVAEQVDAIAELASAAQELVGMAGQLEALTARFVTPSESHGEA